MKRDRAWLEDISTYSIRFMVEIGKCYTPYLYEISRSSLGEE